MDRLDRWLLSYLRLPEWSRWLLLLPVQLVASGLIALVSTMFSLAISGADRGGSPPSWFLTYLVPPFTWAFYAALVNVSFCMFLPRGARFSLYFGAALSVVALVGVGIYSWSVLFGTPERDLNRVLSDFGMSVGNLWLFAHRNDLLAAIDKLKRRANSNEFRERLV